MSYAQITGWGKCIPPASISNDEISNIVDTNDEWISNLAVSAMFLLPI